MSRETESEVRTPSTTSNKIGRRSVDPSLCNFHAESERERKELAGKVDIINLTTSKQKGQWTILIVGFGVLGVVLTLACGGLGYVLNHMNDQIIKTNTNSEETKKIIMEFDKNFVIYTKTHYLEAVQEKAERKKNSDALQRVEETIRENVNRIEELEDLLKIQP